MNMKISNDIVLVVDDSPDALSLINDALEDAGMDVLVALEGKQALTIAKRIRPDIILLDAIMPTMDGFETCENLKADPLLADIPVIFMTGLTDTCDVVRGLDVGGVDYLTKPINPSELLARMRVHLKNARQTSNVQNALDSSGQYLMTLNYTGSVLWGSPQAYAQLAKVGMDEAWLKETLPGRLIPLLADPGLSQNNIRLEKDGHCLELKVLSLQENNQLLVRLIDGNRLAGSALLKEKLEITERESEVLHWIANGKTNREIAEILGMSPRTVNKHLEQLFPKLGVENRTAAAGVALRIQAVES
ncbi:response regulator transcription factor [Neptuniibacter caesariensis]|uniref:Two-component transcriptional regulator, LuxR family protein n=1 Tax=Neptuniibacter caesariensis TaxID=207954 RepID=A0A7U8C515_NEPCE|nr:two-component transcriptional regulator, LuxR family protein [Oceanospirillum sp. MED92] [Neptuniibacter caesariensis]